MIDERSINRRYLFFRSMRSKFFLVCLFQIMLSVNVRVIALGGRSTGSQTGDLNARLAEEGISRARVEIDFDVDSGKTEPSGWVVIRDMYFQGQDERYVQICDLERIARFRKIGLDENLRQASIDKIRSFGGEKPAPRKPLHFTAVIDFFNSADVAPLVQVIGERVPSLSKLMRAAFRGDQVDVNRLLKEGADVNWYNQDGYTALIYAAITGSKVNTLALIQSGANVNENPLGKGTALIAAVGSENKEIVEILLKAGADPNIKNDRGDSPLSIALREKREVLAEILKHAGAREY